MTLPITLIFNTSEPWWWLKTCKNQGHGSSCSNVWVKTNGRADRRTDSTDRFTIPANAVDNNVNSNDVVGLLSSAAAQSVRASTIEFPAESVRWRRTKVSRRRFQNQGTSVLSVTAYACCLYFCITFVQICILASLRGRLIEYQLRLG